MSQRRTSDRENQLSIECTSLCGTWTSMRNRDDPRGGESGRWWFLIISSQNHTHKSVRFRVVFGSLIISEVLRPRVCNLCFHSYSARNQFSGPRDATGNSGKNGAKTITFELQRTRIFLCRKFFFTAAAVQLRNHALVRPWTVTRPRALIRYDTMLTGFLLSWIHVLVEREDIAVGHGSRCLSFYPLLALLYMRKINNESKKKKKKSFYVYIIYTEKCTYFPLYRASRTPIFPLDLFFIYFLFIFYAGESATFVVVKNTDGFFKAYWCRRVARRHTTELWILTQATLYTAPATCVRDVNFTLKR